MVGWIDREVNIGVGTFDIGRMSDTRRNRDDVGGGAKPERPIPAGVRRLMLALGCGAFFFGVASLQEPRHSQANPVPVTASRAEQLAQPILGKLLGSFKTQDMIVELYSDRGRALFRALDLQGEQLTPQITAGKLTTMYPSVDLRTLLASLHPGGGLMIVDEPKTVEGER